MRSSRPAAVAVTLVFAALPLLATVATAAPGNARAEAARAEREATLRYWTAERMRAAIPRDFVFDPVRGFQPAAKPPGTGKPGGGGGGGGSGDTTSTAGASWPDDTGEIYGAVGKVFFTLGGTNYVCSGTTVEESKADRVVVLTAGHCTYDETNGDGTDAGFASRWMFVPRYDATPTVNCFTNDSQCWTASELVVHSGYANAGSFGPATVYDWAFAVIGAGGGPSSTQLQGAADAFGIAPSTSYESKTFMYAFGYPHASPYDGTDLTYCSGKVSFDSRNANRTYKLTCDMTGGSSGGGWSVGFDSTGNVGTLASVNSYRYLGGSAMYGPKFNVNTASTWNAALSTSLTDGDTGVIVP